MEKLFPVHSVLAIGGPTATIPRSSAWPGRSRASFLPRTRMKQPKGTEEDHRAQLAAIVESSEDAIVSKSLEGIIRSWNPGAEKLFGYSAAEAIGQHIKLIIPRDHWAEEDEVLARLSRGARVDHFDTIR